MDDTQRAENLLKLKGLVAEEEWLCRAGDGWTIYSRDTYTGSGVPEVYVPEEYRNTSGSGKFGITRPDGTMGDVIGIHHLQWLYYCARQLMAAPDQEWQDAGLDPTLAKEGLREGVENPYSGRGSQARAVGWAIVNALHPDGLEKAHDG